MTSSSFLRGHDKEKTKKTKKTKQILSISKQVCNFEFNVFGIDVKCQCLEHERNLFSRVTTVGRHSQNDW